MTLHIPGGKPVVLDKRLGGGAHGLVYTVRGVDVMCAKFFTAPAPDAEERITGLVDKTHLVDWAPGVNGLQIAWPAGLLRDDDGALRGFVMPRSRGTSLHVLLHPAQRIEHFPRLTWRHTLAVAIRIAQAFDRLHRRTIVIGDVNPSNILVSVDTAAVRVNPVVSLIDCDSVQFHDKNGRMFPALDVTPEYASPQTLRDRLRRREIADDLFGLAVMVCQLVMDGQHPFEGIPPHTTDSDVIANIKAGVSRLFQPERLTPVEFDLSLETLPERVVCLARRAFVDGHRDPSARPTAREWVSALRKAEATAMGCQLNPLHFSQGGLSHCLWCLRERQGFHHYPQQGGDPT